MLEGSDGLVTGLAIATRQRFRAEALVLLIEDGARQSILMLLNQLCASPDERTARGNGVAPTHFLHLLLDASAQRHIVLILEPAFGLRLLHFVDLLRLEIVGLFGQLELLLLAGKRDGELLHRRGARSARGGRVGLRDGSGLEQGEK